MRYSCLIIFALAACLTGGCANIRGAKLLLPEQFGLTEIRDNIYIETGADEKAKTELLDAMALAESVIKAAYGEVKSHPIVYACVTEACYESFGGMGSRAKVYWDRIILSRRGLNWHFLAHEWSHDEIRTRLSLSAWLRLPQWFDEGLAVAISEAPEHSETHWQFLVASNVARPTREELLTYQSVRQWLDAVRRYGVAQNAERRAKGQPEVAPVYAAAGHEVRPWFNKAGSQGVLGLIKRLNDGEEFEAIYPDAKITAESHASQADTVEKTSL